MLTEQLQELAQSDIYPFHMPGHKRAKLDFPNPYSMDITEIDGFDNLHHAETVLKEEQERAAQLYGSKNAYYLVNGSTCGILAAISAAVPRGSKILAARNSHKAVYHAIYLRQLRAEYLYPLDTRWGIQGQITPAQVEDKLSENPEIRAVVITSPTYDGVVSDIAGIAEVVHRRDIPLIVDEAHGAHLGFHPAFPENGVKLGADAVIMSVHKTMPAFTQTALLHLCSDRIDRGMVEKYLDIYETSSPSYILMAGIEKSLEMIRKQGTQLFDQYADMLGAFRKETDDIRNFKILGPGDFREHEAWAFDPGKIPIVSRCGMSGQKLQERLRQEYHLELEMASGNYALAMTSIMDRQEGFDRLSAALHEIDRQLLSGERMGQNKGGTGTISPREIYRQPEHVMEIYEAEEAAHGLMPFRETAGQVSADTVSLYPPGIPVLVPGEKIDGRIVETIQKCLDMGLDVQGITEDKRINVVKKR